MQRNDQTNSTANVTGPDPSTFTGYGRSRVLRLPGSTRRFRSPRGAITVTSNPLASSVRHSRMTRRSRSAGRLATRMEMLGRRPVIVSPSLTVSD